MTASENKLLPLTPPPSPPRHRRKNYNDPFLDLKTPLPSPSAQDDNPFEPQESTIKTILLTPLLFTSFLLSLFLVNRSDRARRHALHQHSSTRQYLLSYFSPTAWLNPEPYQDPSSSSWKTTNTSTHVEPHSALNPEKLQKEAKAEKNRSWHLNKKIRRMTKLEVHDAFEMRGRVIVGMVVTMVVWTFLLFWGLRWVMRCLWAWWAR